jgi:hypothetical protein
VKGASHEGVARRNDVWSHASVSLDGDMAADEARSTDRVPYRKRRGAETLDLPTATLTLQRPGAEVLAVVRQEPIAELAQS